MRHSGVTGWDLSERETFGTEVVETNETRILRPICRFIYNYTSKTLYT